MAIIEEARSRDFNYETFLDTMQGYIKYNKGRGNAESIIRKIYIKYVYKGNKNQNEVEILYSNIISSIDLATTEREIEELAGIVEKLRQENKIEEKDFNYLINKINEKLENNE